MCLYEERCRNSGSAPFHTGPPVRPAWKPFPDFAPLLKKKPNAADAHGGSIVLIGALVR